jgi:FtsP/CotA-like multicopper oxidase with cupredoxin domain
LVIERTAGSYEELTLRDTINIPYWNGFTRQYPSVRLRIDFRDPNIIGTFPYHCHILQHEDGGMMGLIRVEPAGRTIHPEMPKK